MFPFTKGAAGWQPLFSNLYVLGKDGYRFFTSAKTVTTHWFDEKPAKRTVRT